MTNCGRLTIIDDFSKESVDIVVDHGISGQYVTRVVDAIARFRPLPQTLRTDQGPEFTGRRSRARCVAAGRPVRRLISSFRGV